MLLSSPPHSCHIPHQELLPFLTDGMDDEDEVLAAIASNLRNLIPHVGGPSSATVLLSPLELLLTVEEATVRNEACETAKVIAQALPDGPYRTEYADMVVGLARKEWFTSRMSAANLIAVGYERMGLGAGGAGGWQCWCAGSAGTGSSDGDGGSGMTDEEAASSQAAVRGASVQLCRTLSRRCADGPPRG